MMKNLITLLISVIAANASAAESFENAGFIEEVFLSTNIITVNKQQYHLSNTIMQDGTPVIFQLKSGSFVTFSGIAESPDWTIKTLHVYPPEINTESSEPESKQ